MKRKRTQRRKSHRKKKVLKKKQKRPFDKESWACKYLIGRIRQIWGWYPSRRQVKDRGNCEKCKLLLPNRDGEVDHIIPVGRGPRLFKDVSAFLARVLCPIENLQYLCKYCHGEKTKVDLKNMRRENK